MKSLDINFVKNIIKKADLPTFEGQGHINKRKLKWIRFDRNSLTRYLSSLPEAPKIAIIKKMNEFDNEFRKMDAAQNQRYSGMLWIAYAEDMSISQEVIKHLSDNNTPPQLKRLLATAEFVRNNAIQLPPLNSENGIGSDYWLSMFGYAYKGREGFEVITKKGFMNRQIKPFVGGKTKYPQGRLVVAPYGNGYRPIILSNEEIPVFAGQAPQNTRQFFKGNFLLLGMGVVYVPPEGYNSVVDEEVARESMPSLNGSVVVPIENVTAKNLVSQNKNQLKFIYGIYADENGCLYIQKRTRFLGRGSASSIEGDPIYLNADQVLSLIEPSRLNVNHVIRPAEKEDEFNYEGLVKGTKFVYLLSDDSKERIKNPQTEEDWTVSEPAMRALKSYIDSLSYQNKQQDSHTAFEGYYIVMVGPKFIRAKNIGEGKALARPFIDPKSVSKVYNPQISENEVIVDRNIKWIVVSNSISETRRLQNERYYQSSKGSTKTYLDEWTVIDEFETPQEAVDKMIEFANGKGGSLPRISVRAESLNVAQQALQQAQEMEKQIDFEDLPNNEENNQNNRERRQRNRNDQQDRDLRASSLLRRIMKNV